MGVPSITYTLKRGQNTAIPAHASQEIFNDARVSFNSGYNQVVVTYTASESLNRMECRVTYEGNEYGLGVGLLAYENYGSIATSGTFTVAISLSNFTWGDGLYRIGFYARSLATEDWNFQYFFLDISLNSANAITDLTGYTWFANNNINSQVFSYNLNFTDQIDQWTLISMRNNSGVYELLYLNTNTSLIVYKSTTGWVNNSHKIIEISGGSDATNATLISYLSANGTLNNAVSKILATGPVGTSVAQTNVSNSSVGQFPSPSQTDSTLRLY